MTTTDGMRLTTVLRGVPLMRMTEQQCAEHIVSEAGCGHGGWVLTVNTDILRRLQRDATFRELVSPASVVVADGMPLVWASWILGEPLPERVAGSSLLHSVSRQAGVSGRSVFLLGGNPGTAAGTATVLGDTCPGLRVTGWYCPPKGFMNNPLEMEAIRRELETSAADVVFVALPCPLQEELIAVLRVVLPQAWWLGIGVSFSLASGELQRAPAWMSRLSLEWVHRLAQEPRRLFRRYLIDDLPYALGLLGWAGLRRIR